MGIAGLPTKATCIATGGFGRIYRVTSNAVINEGIGAAIALELATLGLKVIGTATTDRAAELKVTGPDGRSHYVMAFVIGGNVPQGGEILLQSRDESTGHYRGTPNNNPDLSPSLYS